MGKYEMTEELLAPRAETKSNMRGALMEIEALSPMGSTARVLSNAALSCETRAVS